MFDFTHRRISPGRWWFLELSTIGQGEAAGRSGAGAAMDGGSLGNQIGKAARQNYRNEWAAGGDVKCKNSGKVARKVIVLEERQGASDNLRRHANSANVGGVAEGFSTSYPQRRALAFRVGFLRIRAK